jgi:hypothetical protein
VTDPGERELRDTRRDDPGRFLRELRALRSHAGLGHAELAARAHYPCEAIKAAEAGPSLPDLPVLSAYVRGCGGTVAEWEERWRAVTGRPASPLLAARGSGWSEAADAGSRIAAVPFAADEPDSDRVMAALNRAANMDVWTPAAPATTNADPWKPAAQTAPGLETAASSKSALPLARTGQPTQSRRPLTSRTALAVCAAVTLVLVAILVALLS